MWGSSYLFIKLAVDDFGTFTLVALRLARRRGPAVDRGPDRQAAAAARAPDLRPPVVMAVINITIPFLLITWAEQSVESSLAAILTSPVPLFAIVLSPIFLPDEPMRVNGVVGLVVGFIGVVIITSRGPVRAEGRRSSASSPCSARRFSYACGAVYSRRNVRGLPPMIPAVFQVTFAAIITGVIALLFEQPWTATPDAEAIFSILWLGILGSGLAYLLVFRLFAAWGATRTTLVAYLIPVVGHRPRLPRPRRSRSTRR